MGILENAIIRGEDALEKNRQEKAQLDRTEMHIELVNKAFKTHFVSLLGKDIDHNFQNFTRDEFMQAINLLIINRDVEMHDNSKWSEEEFDPYRAWWYPTEYEKSLGKDFELERKQNFKKAWDHHRFTNDHHGDFWYDFETNTAKDMPLHCIIHMLSDWIAMGMEYHSSTKDWYENKAVDEKKHLSEPTKLKLEEILYEIIDVD